MPPDVRNKPKIVMKNSNSRLKKRRGLECPVFSDFGKQQDVLI